MVSVDVEESDSYPEDVEDLVGDGVLEAVEEADENSMSATISKVKITSQNGIRKKATRKL